MFRAGSLTRVAGALFFDSLKHMVDRVDDWACNGDEKFTDCCFDIYSVVSARMWMIMDALKEYCLKGYVNIRGYVNS